MKGIVEESLDRVRVADVVWRQGVRPSMMQGSEVIATNKTWIKQLEEVQNKVGRWILKVGNRTPAVGVRAELSGTQLEAGCRRESFNGSKNWRGWEMRDG